MGFIVVNFSNLFIHQAFKNIIGRFQHLKMTAEIFLKDNQLALTAILLIGLKLITENLRVCLTETVDRLLDITYHKAILSSGKQV